MADELFEIESAEESNPPKRDADAPVTIVVRLYVQPGAGRSMVVGRRGNALHIRVAPPPANDRANRAAEALLADLFDVPKSKVQVIAGHKSRDKRLQAQDVVLEHVRAQIAHAIAEPAPGPAHNQGRIRPQR